MVSLEAVKSKLIEIERKNIVMSKPDILSSDFFLYMKQRVILLNAKYTYLKDQFPEMDKFTLRNER